MEKYCHVWKRGHVTQRMSENSSSHSSPTLLSLDSVKPWVSNWKPSENIILLLMFGFSMRMLSQVTCKIKLKFLRSGKITTLNTVKKKQKKKSREQVSVFLPSLKNIISFPTTVKKEYTEFSFSLYNFSNNPTFVV